MISSYLIRGLVAAGAISCFSAANAQWVVKNLHPEGAAYSYAFAIADGQQVGQVAILGENIYRASLWTGRADSWTDLNSGTSSVGLAAGGGRQGGYRVISQQPYASLWDDNAGALTNLSPVGSINSQIAGMNATHQVGNARFGDIQHAGMWSGSAASWVDLHPGGPNSSFAWAVNGTTQVGYYVHSSTNDHACMWTGTAASMIDLHPAGASISRATAVHGSMQAGFAKYSGKNYAGFWLGSAGSWGNLMPVGATESEVTGLSNGVQVGYATFSGVPHAGMWNSTVASWYDLHPAGFSFSIANGIWHDGTDTHIVGWAQKTNGERNAMMWSRPGADRFLLSLNKERVAGQNSVQGTITMGSTSATPTIFTTSDNSQLVTTPASVTVPANTYFKNFQITVSPVVTNWSTTITAKLGALTRSVNLNLVPLIPTAIAFTPVQATGGQTVSARVVINGVAGPNGLTLAVFDNSTYTTMPSTIVIPAGATQVTFPITTTTVSSMKEVRVTARNSAGEKVATFRIFP